MTRTRWGSGDMTRWGVRGDDEVGRQNKSFHRIIKFQAKILKPLSNRSHTWRHIETKNKHFKKSLLVKLRKQYCKTLFIVKTENEVNLINITLIVFNM